LDLDFKAAPNFDHVAKFRGDRWRDLKDFAPRKANAPNIFCEAPPLLETYII